jgi:hypothetical protein
MTAAIAAAVKSPDFAHTPYAGAFFRRHRLLRWRSAQACALAVVAAAPFFASETGLRGVFHAELRVGRATMRDRDRGFDHTVVKTL